MTTSRATGRRRASARAAAVALAALAALGVVPASGASAAAEAPAPAPASASASASTYIVRVVPGQAGAVADAARSAGVQVDRTLAAVDAVLVQATPSAARRLTSRPGVVAVSPDQQLKLSAYSAGGDPSSLYRSQDSTDARAPWANGAAGSGVDVAVIDTGVDRVKGLDAPGKVIYGPDFTPENADPAKRNRDLYGHGTHMAGIIAGADADPESNVYNATPFLGVAPRARIVSLKVATGIGETNVAAVLSSLDWVIANRWSYGLNIRVVNLSFGTDSTQDYRIDPLAYAVEKVWLAGIPVVVSAGNNGTTLGRLDNPARDPYVIAVGSANTRGTDSRLDDVVSAFSSRGDGVRNPDLIAPGQSMQSLRVPGSFIDVNSPRGVIDARFFRGSGTSQAAAFTSGVVAMMVGRYGGTPDEIKATLRRTADPIPYASEAAQGQGLIDADDAVLGPLSWGASQRWTRSGGTGTLAAAGDANVTGKAWAGKAWAGKAWATNWE